MTNKFFTTERLMLAFFVVGSFVGIWHALPLVNIVADEMYYVGGVFRAFEAKSLLPLPGDVPYGTLTYYLNYLLEIPFTLVLLTWQGFHLAALKDYLVLHPETAYIVPRFLSGLIAAVFAWWYNRFLRGEGVPLPLRFAALAALFCTIVPAVIWHTGKMWVLSFMLVAVSMLYLYRILAQHTKDGAVPRRDVYISITAAFLAVVNFPFTLPFLIIIPILLYFFRRDREAFKTVLWASGAGVLVFVCLFSLNASNYVSLLQIVFTGYHPIVTTGEPVFQISFLESLRLHGWQLIAAFPLALLLLLWAATRRAIGNRPFFYISLGYAALYFLSLSLLATYYNDPNAFLRYLFPFGFFFSGMVASLAYEKLRPWVLVFGAAQVIVYLYVLFLLSVPTTFNQARDYLVQHYAAQHALIYDNLVELDVPQNTQSSLLTQNAFCASKCQYLRTASTTAGFVPIVLDLHSTMPAGIAAYSPILWVGEATSTACAGAPLASFAGGASAGNYFSIEHALGDYLAPAFWRLSRLGKNVYIYQVSAACFKTLYAAK